MLLPYAGLFAVWKDHTVSWTFDALRDGGRERPIGQALRERIHKELSEFLLLVQEVDLPMTRVAAERMLSSLTEDDSGGHVGDEVLVISDRLRDEVESRLFLYVGESNARYYEHPLDGWGAVPDKLTNAKFDIEEAGRCLALSLPTACVFHLMRAAEVALRAVARKLGVTTLSKKKPLDEADWLTVLNAIDGRIAALRSAPANTRTAKIVFYSEVRAELAAFKDAWRNPVAHARTRYDERQARLIYEHVRAFMVRLVAGLAR